MALTSRHITLLYAVLRHLYEPSFSLFETKSVHIFSLSSNDMHFINCPINDLFVICGILSKTPNIFSHSDLHCLSLKTLSIFTLTSQYLHSSNMCFQVLAVRPHLVQIFLLSSQPSAPERSTCSLLKLLLDNHLNTSTFSTALFDRFLLAYRSLFTFLFLRMVEYFTIAVATVPSTELLLSSVVKNFVIQAFMASSILNLCAISCGFRFIMMLCCSALLHRENSNLHLLFMFFTSVCGPGNFFLSWVYLNEIHEYSSHHWSGFR